MKKKYWRILFLVIITLQVFNILNSSIFSHTFTGQKISPAWGVILGYLRLPIVFVPIVLFSALSTDLKRHFYFFLRQNWDVMLFLLSAWISMLINPTFDSVFYTLWHSASFYVALLFLFFMRINNLGRSYLLLGKVFIFSNLAVVPFLLMRFSSVFTGKRVDMPYSHITFYPYCLLSILIGILIVLAYKFRKQLFKDDFFQKRSIIYYVGAVIFIFVYMSASGRRTPMIAGILILIYFIYALLGTSAIQKTALRLAIVLTLVIGIANFSNIVERYSAYSQTLYKLSILSFDQNFQLNEGKYSESFAIRVRIWESYFEILEKNPLFGVGLNNGRTVHKATFPNVAFSGYSTHNTFVGILVEQGIVGFLFFIIFFFRSLIIGIRQDALIRNLTLVIFFTVVLINWNEFNALSGQVFFWTTTIGILMSRIFLLQPKPVPFTKTKSLQAQPF